jgi:hypothetical protein
VTRPPDVDPLALAGDYLAINRANWDDRSGIHAASAGYDLGRYREDPAAISDVVAFDRPLLGDVTGLATVHLQCHIGTDTLSLARLGARMTGVNGGSASIRSGCRCPSP